MNEDVIHKTNGKNIILKSLEQIVNPYPIFNIVSDVNYFIYI